MYKILNAHQKSVDMKTTIVFVHFFCYVAIGIRCHWVVCDWMLMFILNRCICWKWKQKPHATLFFTHSAVWICYHIIAFNFKCELSTAQKNRKVWRKHDSFSWRRIFLLSFRLTHNVAFFLYFTWTALSGWKWKRAHFHFDDDKHWH